MSITTMILKRIAKIMGDPRKTEKFKKKLSSNPELSKSFTDLARITADIKKSAQDRAKHDPVFAGFYDALNKALDETR